MQNKIILVTDAQHATILAALRYYQASGQCNPDYRHPGYSDIATNCGTLTSLNESEVDALCDQIQFAVSKVDVLKALDEGDLKSAELATDLKPVVPPQETCVKVKYWDAYNIEGTVDTV